MSFRLGLTGSIGMGKSTAAGMFADLGHPVWDADAAVHRLYAAGGAAVGPMAARFPDAVRDGAVARDQLSAIIAADPQALTQIEQIVHPLVWQDRAQAIDEATASAKPLIILDIPLLYETGSDAQMDGVAVVSTDAETQRGRVLARPGMSAEKFEQILSRQMPDAEKRRRARWIIPSDTLEGARAAVARICAEITGQPVPTL